MLSALSAVFILSMFIPKVANIFDRFMDEENIMALGNRDSLWKYFLLMGENTRSLAQDSAHTISSHMITDCV